MRTISRSFAHLLAQISIVILIASGDSIDTEHINPQKNSSLQNLRRETELISTPEPIKYPSASDATLSRHHQHSDKFHHQRHKSEAKGKDFHPVQPLLLVGHNTDKFNMSESSPNFAAGFIVGTMTTTPKRLAEVTGPFGETLHKLLSISLLDRLYLNVPWVYGIRKKHENVTLPTELLSLMEQSHGKLRIIRCPDYGPSTKLLPTILLPDSELPPNSMIITFDDDRLYTSIAVESLVSLGRKHIDSVVTIAAWPIDILSTRGKRGRPGGPDFYSRIPRGKEGIQYKFSGPVDLILGFYGVLYRKRFFYKNYSPGSMSAFLSAGTQSGPYKQGHKGEHTAGELDMHWFDYTKHTEFMKHCAWVDDIWFSGHLERLHIPRYVIGNVPDSRADITKLSNVNALSLDQGESVKQNFDNVNCAEAMRKEYGIWAKPRRRLVTGW